MNLGLQDGSTLKTLAGRKHDLHAEHALPRKKTDDWIRLPGH